MLFKSISQSLCCIALAGMLFTGCQSQKEQEASTEYPEMTEETSCKFNAGIEIAAIYQADNFDYSYDLWDSINNSLRSQTNCILNSYKSIPQPTDLVKYFEHTPRELIRLRDWDYDSAVNQEDSSFVFFDRIKLLQKYHDYGGEFPYKELWDEIQVHHKAISMLNSEAGGDAIHCAKLALYFRLMQQIVRLCPDMKRWADVITDDNKVALIDHYRHDYIYLPSFNPIFVRNDEGEWEVHIKSYLTPQDILHKRINGKDKYLFKMNQEALKYQFDSKEIVEYLFDAERERF